LGVESEACSAAIRNRSRYLRSVLPSLLALPVQKKLRQAFWLLCSSRAACRERGVQRRQSALLAAGHACQQLVKLVNHVSAASKACRQVVRGCPRSQSRYLLRHAFCSDPTCVSSLSAHMPGDKLLHTSNLAYLEATFFYLAPSSSRNIHTRRQIPLHNMSQGLIAA